MRETRWMISVEKSRRKEREVFSLWKRSAYRLRVLRCEGRWDMSKYIRVTCDGRLVGPYCLRGSDASWRNANRGSIQKRSRGVNIETIYRTVPPATRHASTPNIHPIIPHQNNKQRPTTLNQHSFVGFKRHVFVKIKNLLHSYF